MQLEVDAKQCSGSSRAVGSLPVRLAGLMLQCSGLEILDPHDHPYSVQGYHILLGFEPGVF